MKYAAGFLIAAGGGAVIGLFPIPMVLTIVLAVLWGWFAMGWALSRLS